jgi:hypothetical protein
MGNTNNTYVMNLAGKKVNVDASESIVIGGKSGNSSIVIVSGSSSIVICGDIIPDVDNKRVSSFSFWPTLKFPFAKQERNGRVMLSYLICSYLHVFCVLTIARDGSSQHNDRNP